MKTFDISPLFRATVGFDRLFDMLDSSVNTRPDWPPYNIEKSADDQYRITMALAGFAPDDIELTQQGSTLLVSGQKKAGDRGARDYLHQGLAHRSSSTASSSLVRNSGRCFGPMPGRSFLRT